MRRPLLVRALLAIAVLAAAAPAIASPQRTVCHLLGDAEGDVPPAAGTDAVPVPDKRDAELDILSADIAADAKNVTVLLRLKDLTAPDPGDTDGFSYHFYFTANEHVFWFAAEFLTGGSDFRVWTELQKAEAGGGSASSGTSIGVATGSIDLRRHEVRIRAPRSLFESTAHLSRGTSLYDLSAWSWRSVGIDSNDSFAAVEESADVAHDDKVSYRVGQPSCIL